MKELIRRIGVSLAVGLVFSALTCAAAWAQSTAQITGTVTDQSGAILPGVEVTATQIETGLVRTVLSNETGSYVVPTVPVGPYRLEAGLPGFRTYVQTGIVLTVGANSVINIVLEVGQVSESVEVQANTALVETQSTGVSQVMDSIRVLELPLNGRQVVDLIVLSGAATVGGGSFVRGYPTVNISVAGGLHNGVTYLLDGGSHNDPFNNLNLPLPFPDALQEFKLETSGLSAQYGQHSAGTVNAVTKSGTNEFHGNLFEFHRNGAVNARNAFAAQADSLKRNQFGGTFGGPIMKNKLFFFGAYQGTRIRATPDPRFAYIPTPAMVAGDWTAIASAECNVGRQRTLRAPFQNQGRDANGNTIYLIDPARFSPVALNLLKHLPTPTNPCGEVQYGVKSSANEDVSIAKVDYQVSERHSLFGRYLLAHAVAPAHFNPSDPMRLLTTGGSGSVDAYTTYPVVNDWQSQSFTLADTYLIGDRIVNSFRGTLLRPTNFRGQPPVEVTPEEIGIKGLWQPEDLANRFTSVSVSGGFSIGGAGGNVPGDTNSTAYQVSDDLSWVRGSHQLGFGVSYIRSIMNSKAWSNTDGSFNFTATATGLGLGDFMIGAVNRFRQSDTEQFYFRAHYASMFLQDAWKVTPRLTLNLGLRWDPFLPLAWQDGEMQHFDKKWFDAGIRSTVYKNGPAGVLYHGDEGVPDDGKVGPNEWMNFSPRFGFAWDPAGDGRMAIRSSYGLFRDYPDFYKFHYTRKSPPWASQIEVSGVPFDDPWRNYPGGNPFPVEVTPDVAFPLSATYTNRPLDLPSVYVHQWNLSVQKQFGTDWLLSGSYIGNSTIHLLNKSEGNPAVFIPGLGDASGNCFLNGQVAPFKVTAGNPCSTTGNTSERRKLYLQNPAEGKYFGYIVNLDAGGTMSYNGMLLTAQHRPANGLTLQMNYTWSHCINTGTNQLLFTTGGYTPERRGANRGNCAGLEVDRRHNFNLSTVYALPRFSNPVLGVLATGWQVSGIVKLLTGSYLTIDSGLDNAFSATDDQTANQVLASPYAANKSVDQWLNPDAFEQPAPGTYGNMGQRNILGPGSIRIDMGLTRRFAVREGQSIEFRAESFNVPNRVNLGNPNTTLTSSSFGKIQSANDPRILQFALKYVF